MTYSSCKETPECYKGPFLYDRNGTMIFSNNTLALDVRGWGSLSSEMPVSEAISHQDKFGDHVCKCLNTHDEMKRLLREAVEVLPKGDLKKEITINLSNLGD